MEGYHRDSLRELRRMEAEQQSEKREKGSVFITLLIILMFLAAGGFYLKTTDRLPESFSFSSVKQTVIRWKEELVAVMKGEEVTDVQATVDGVLAGQNEEG